jgi:purine-binding chemotaxis protein CheW
VDKLNQLVVLTLDEQRYALHLSAVERIVRMVEITPLPKAPQIVLGVVNVQGRIVPIVNIRKRFSTGLKSHEKRR